MATGCPSNYTPAGVGLVLSLQPAYDFVGRWMHIRSVQSIMGLLQTACSARYQFELIPNIELFQRST